MHSALAAKPPFIPCSERSVFLATLTPLRLGGQYGRLLGRFEHYGTALKFQSVSRALPTYLSLLGCTLEHY